MKRYNDTTEIIIRLQALQAEIKGLKGLTLSLAKKTKVGTFARGMTLSTVCSTKLDGEHLGKISHFF